MPTVVDVSCLLAEMVGRCAGRGCPSMVTALVDLVAMVTALGGMASLAMVAVVSGLCRCGADFA